jgi:hypothetical protein
MAAMALNCFRGAAATVLPSMLGGLGAGKLKFDRPDFGRQIARKVVKCHFTNLKTSIIYISVSDFAEE